MVCGNGFQRLLFTNYFTLCFSLYIVIRRLDAKVDNKFKKNAKKNPASGKTDEHGSATVAAP